MSLRKFLMAGGLSMILILGSCGGGEEAEEENPQEEDAEADVVDDGMDAAADEAEKTDENAGVEGDEETDESTADVQEEAEDDGAEQSKTFVLEEAGSYNELTYHYVGDEVKRQTSTTEMDYEALGVTNEEDARLLLDDIARDYNATEGVQHDIRYSEDAFVETLEVDYEIADISEVSELEGADFEGADGAQFVSMARSEEQLLDSGYILADGEPAADNDSADNENQNGSARNIDFSVMDEKLSADGMEIPSMFELNSGIGSLLENAEPSDANINDVLKPSDEITTYFSETFMVIHVFAGGSEYPADSDFAGLNAEIDESGGFEVYTEFYDTLSGTFLPNIYANEIQFLAHDGSQWIDQTGTAGSEEVYYGNYSNLYDAFMTTSDLISISEDEDYYFLYNIGVEKSLHDVFGSIFNVEYTGADMDAMQNAVVGIVDKSTGEFVHVAYISTAPGLDTDEVLHIEISAEFDAYGEYDDGITVPEVSESRSAGAPAVSGMITS